MEIDKTVRTLNNLLKTFEKNESCALKEISVRNSNSNELIEKLIDILQSKEIFFEKTVDELRSLNFLLLLNTDFGITEELEGHSDIGHAIGAVPPLSAYVYLMLCVELDLIKYLKEVIECGPLAIITPTLKAIQADIKYLQPCHHFDVLAVILAALFVRLCSANAPTVPLIIYDTFQVFLLLYKEDELATNFDSRVSSGYKWLSLLRLVRSTSRIRFSTKWKPVAIELFAIQISNDLKYGEMNKDKAVEEFYERIFYKCRAFADILDMNLFMAWHEIEDNGLTLQNIIGTEAYKLRALLEKYKKLYSLPSESTELIEILRSVQRVPDKETPTKEEKLDKDELKERICKKSQFDAKFIADAETLISEDATALDLEMIKMFIHKLCSNNVNGIREETIRNLILLLLRRMELNEISQFVGEFVQKYGLHNILYQNATDLSPLIEKLNGVNSDDEEAFMKIFKEIILSAFSFAPQVLAVLLKEGCTEANKRAKIVELFDLLKSVCVYSNEKSSEDRCLLLTSVVQTFFSSGFLSLTVAERHHFFQLVEELCQKNLIDTNAFLQKCLLRSLDARESSSWQILSEILTFLKKFIDDNRVNLKLDLSKILLQLLRFIESARWNIITFTTERLKACEEGIEVLEMMRKQFPHNEYSTKMENILKSDTYRFSDLTRVYFRDICPSLFGDSIEHNLISLIREPLRPNNVSSFVREVEEKEAIFILRMGELLPRLTSKELQNMVSHYGEDDANRLTCIFDLISNGISFIGSCAAQYSTMPQVNVDAIISCIGQMLNNFLVVLQINWPVFLAVDQKFYFVKYVKRIATVLREFPSHLVQPYQFNLIKFVDDSLIKLKAVGSETEMTESMIREFDRNVRQLFVGFTLL